MVIKFIKFIKSPHLPSLLGEGPGVGSSLPSLLGEGPGVGLFALRNISLNLQ